MRTEPPQVLEKLVAWMLPEAAREHVLGDLQERFEAHRSVGRYLLDALGIVPCVIASRARRNWTAPLAVTETGALLVALMIGSRGGASVSEVVGAFIVGSVALALGEAYTNPRRTTIPVLRQWALAFGAISLIGLRALAFKAALPGLALLLMARMAFRFIRPKTPVRPVESMADVRAEAEWLRTTVRDRNRREHAAAVITGGMFVALLIFKARTWPVALGTGLIIGGLVLIGINLRRRTDPPPVAGDAPDSEYVAAYRAELVRQRAALLKVLWWYVAPLIPGFLVTFVAQASGPGAAQKLVSGGLGLIAISWLIVWANRRGAERLQRKIDVLDSWWRRS